MTENPQKTKKSRVQLNSHDDSLYTSQLNNSSSKQLYSLTKEPRFKDKKIPSNQPSLYQLPTTKSNRSASFGYGNKIDISKLANKGPSPDAYKSQSDFENTKKGIGMGLGRSNIKAVNAFGQKPFVVPGVGSYSIKDPKNNQTISFSGRNIDLTEKYIRSLPGPGNYETLELLDKNLNSKFRNGRSQRFAKNEDRSQNEKKLKKNYIPGPGQYNQEKKNYDIIDRFMQNKGKSFGKTPRPDIANMSGFPGPGSYKHLSQFIH